MSIDLRKAAIEVTRWYILQTLDAGRPMPVAEDLLLSALNGADLRLTPLELRRELGYLRDRKLIELRGEDSEHWIASLTALGTDVVEYTVECHPGIARPPKR